MVPQTPTHQNRRWSRNPCKTATLPQHTRSPKLQRGKPRTNMDQNPDHNQTTIPRSLYYGPQEKADRDSVYREYQKIRTTINQLKDKGDIIIIGDYNAKIQINHPTYQQETSRNGTLLAQLIEDTNTQTPTTSTETLHWTRENRNNPNEKSIIDYVLADTNIAKQITELKIDDTGLYSH